MASSEYPLNGAAHGTAITTGNTGASIVNLGAGSTGAYDSAAGDFGHTVGVRLIMASGTSPAFRFAAPATATRMRMLIGVTPRMVGGTSAVTTGSFTVMNIRHSSGTICTLVCQYSTGNVVLVDGTAGTVLGTIHTGATAGTKYRYRVDIDTSTGATSVKAYDTTGTQIGSTLSGTYTYTTPGTGVAAIQFGASFSGQTAQMDVTYARLDDGAGSDIPFPDSNASPSVSVTSDQTVAASSTVNVAATASDSDGTIASYAWSFDYPSSGTPSWTGGSTANASFTAGAAGSLYIVRCTVTDDDGATSSATTEVRVPATGDVTVLPMAASGSAGWAAYGGAASTQAGLSDANGSTGAESPDMTGSVSTQRWRLAPMAARSSLAITLTNVALTASTSHNSAVRIYSGSTQVAERSLSAVTTTAGDVTVTLTSGELASIADWGALAVELRAVL